MGQKLSVSPHGDSALGGFSYPALEATEQVINLPRVLTRRGLEHEFRDCCNVCEALVAHAPRDDTSSLRDAALLTLVAAGSGGASLVALRLRFHFRFRGLGGEAPFL